MAARNDPVGQATSRATQLDERPWHVFTVPEDMQDLTLPGGDPIKSIAMVELTAHDLRMVYKSYVNDTSQASQQQVIHSLACINCDDMGAGGKQLSVADGSADKVVARMHPRVLALALNAYVELHENTVEKTRGFLKTKKVVTRG